MSKLTYAVQIRLVEVLGGWYGKGEVVQVPLEISEPFELKIFGIEAALVMEEAIVKATEETGYIGHRMRREG